MPYHVIPTESGWAVKKSNAARNSFTYSTKQPAVSKGKKLAKKADTELNIHDSNGRVIEKHSYGNDPRSVKG